MKLSIVVTALIGAATAVPTDPLVGVTPVERAVDLFKRECASGGLCNNAGKKLCLCNQGKRVCALFLSLCVIFRLHSMRSVHARGFQMSHQAGI